MVAWLWAIASCALIFAGGLFGFKASIEFNKQSSNQEQINGKNDGSASLARSTLATERAVRESDSGADSEKLVQDKPEYEIIPVEQEGRVYFNNRPEQLIAQIEGLTELQGSLFVEQNLKGKWIRIKGPIENIRGNNNYAQIVFKIDGVVTRMTFEKEFISHVSHLKNGEIVTVEGKLYNMDQKQIMFEHSKLINKN